MAQLHISHLLRSTAARRFSLSRCLVSGWLFREASVRGSFAPTRSMHHDISLEGSAGLTPARGGSGGGVLRLEEGGELPRRRVVEDQRARQRRRALAERLRG